MKIIKTDPAIDLADSYATAAIPLYINPEAGANGDRALENILEVLKSHGLIVDVHITQPEFIAEEVKDAARRGNPVIAVAGGDGTISTVAGVLTGFDSAFVPIPIGTLNHFARGLGITSVDKAAQAILKRQVHAVSVGDINGVVFINNISCGLYPHIVRRRERLHRWLPKWLSFVIGGTIALIHLPKLNLSIVVGDKEIKRTTSFFWAGIGRGSFQFPGRAIKVENAHLLEVVIARARTRLGHVALGIMVLFGLLRGKRPGLYHGLEVIHAHKVVVSAQKRIYVGRDGEVDRLNSPLAIGVRASALKIVVPGD